VHLSIVIKEILPCHYSIWRRYKM